MKNNEKGFALALSIFMMVAVVAIMVGSYLSLSQGQRNVSRSASEVHLRWAAQAAIDKAINDMHAQVTTQNKLLIEKSELEGIEAKAETWFADNAIFKKEGYKLDRNLIQIKKLVDAELNDDNYSVTAEVAFDNNKTRLILSEEVTLHLGSLFDYGVFYQDDLELAPGNKAEFQGPFFSNGDIYLMPMVGSDKSLSLKMPEDGTTIQNIMQAAGNIYAFYKPVIAKNYMMDINEYYQNLKLPKRFNNEAVNHHAEMVNATPDQTPFPLIYFFKNDIFPEVEKKFYSGDGANASQLFLTDSDGSNPIQLMFPPIEYSPISWDFMLGHLAPEYHSYNSHYISQDSKCPAGGVCMNVSPAYESFQGIAAQAQKIKWNTEKDWLGEPADYVEYMPARNPAWKSAQNGILKDKVKDEAGSKSLFRRGATASAEDLDNHLMIESQIENCAAKATADEKKNCSLIEQAKFINKADLKLLCADANCESLDLYDKNGKVNNPVKFWDETSKMRDDRARQAYQAVQIDIEKLIQPTTREALGVKGKPIILYVQARSFEMAKNAKLSYAPQGSDTYDPLAIDNSIRLVLLTNGKQLPMEGMTIATNGKVWIHGDYNTTTKDGGTCVGGVTDSYPDCVKTLPSAAIFSDSIGVLSNDYDIKGWSLNNNFTDHAPATRDVSVHVGVVTGYIPSTLERWYPNCKGKNENGEFSLAGCRGEDNVVFQTSAYGSKPENAGHYIYNKNPEADLANQSVLSGGYYKDANGVSQPTGNCPDGVNSLGIPNNPEKCDIVRENGVFYVRRNFFIKKFWDDLWVVRQEVQDYQKYNFVVEKGNGDLEFSKNGKANESTGFNISDSEPQYSGGDMSAKDKKDLKEDIESAFKRSSTVEEAELDRNLLDRLQTGISYDVTLPVIQTVDRHILASGKIDTLENQILLFAGEGCTNSRPTESATCKPTKFLWYDNADILKDQTTRDALLGNGYPANIKAKDDTLYRIYWRKINIDFKNIPNWRVPLHFSSYFVQNKPGDDDLDGRFCAYDWQAEDALNKVGCRPEPSSPWPGIGLGQNEYTLNRPYIGDANSYAAVVITTSFESGGSGSSQVTPDRVNYYPRPTNPLRTYQGPFPSVANYSHAGRYAPQHRKHFSGGVGNLITFQEQWAGKTFYFSGTLTAPWFAKELWRESKGSELYRSLKYKHFEPAYYDIRDAHGAAIYTAPERIFDYNEQLARTPPPGAPNLYGTARTKALIERETVPK